MGRKARTYDDRRNELLDAAWSLFSQSGWDGTTVQAVIDLLGVSKGTFYHYFESKEDLLDGVVERQSIQAIEAVRAAVELEESALTRLSRFISATREWRVTRLAAFRNVLRVLYRDENIIIRYKIRKRNTEMVVPLLTGIIAQGAEEGVFDVEEPEETAELFLHMSHAFSEKSTRLFLDLPDQPDNVDRLARRARLYLRILEKILGLPPDSIETPDRSFYERLKEDSHD